MTLYKIYIIKRCTLRDKYEYYDMTSDLAKRNTIINELRAAGKDVCVLTILPDGSTHSTDYYCNLRRVRRKEDEGE